MDHSTYEPSPGRRESEQKWLAATGWEAGGRGRGGEVVGSYWMGGNRREGKWLIATEWEAIGGRGRGGEVVSSYWMGGSRREGEGRGGEVVGSYWMGGSRREGKWLIATEWEAIGGRGGEGPCDGHCDVDHSTYEPSPGRRELEQKGEGRKGREG